jgi:succinyl-diaminopimelate desuccinylase
LFFGLSEENGGNDIRYYVENGGEIPVMGFTPDGEYPVIHGEKGFIIEHYRYEYGENSIGNEVITNYDNFFDGYGNDSFSPKWRLKSIQGGTAENIVPHFAKAVLIRTVKNEWAEEVEEEFTYSVKGVSAHAASPWEGENAIQKLLSQLAEFPLCDETKAVVQFLHEKFKMEHDGTSLGIAMSDKESGPLTMNLGMINGDESGIEIGLNYRYPVTASFEDCEPILRRQFEDAGFLLTEQEHDPCLYMPTDSELVKRLMKVYKETTGREDDPKCIGGATYAKALPNVLAFGPLFPDDENREHKPDEYVEIDWLMRNAVIIAEAMYALAVD